MNSRKPLFMKTYGKCYRKVSAWLSPDNRKQAFDSSLSAEVDSCDFDPSISTEIRMESNTCASHKGVRPAKRKATKYRKEKENMYPSPAVHPPVVQKKKQHRRKKARLCYDSSDSEADSKTAPKRRKVTAQRKENVSVGIPSAGRFVTRRRAPTLRPKASTLNSSDDFESVAPRRILRPPRHRAPSVLQSSAGDVSELATGTRSSASGLLPPEGSLVEDARHGLGHCPRKPLFCSTPSASLHKRPRPEPSPATAPPHGTLSHSSIFSASQEDLDLPGRPFCAPGAVAPALGESQGEPSLSFVSSRDGPPRAAVDSHQATPPPVSPDPSSSSDDDDDGGGSRFVSAAAGLEWLVESLKRDCVAKRCTVLLERVENLVADAGLLHSHSTYSSCLDRSGSGSLQPSASTAESVSADTAHSEEEVGDLPSAGRPGSAADATALTDGPVPSSEAFTGGFRSVDHMACSEDSRVLSAVCADSHSIDDDREDDADETDDADADETDDDADADETDETDDDDEDSVRSVGGAEDCPPDEEVLLISPGGEQGSALTDKHRLLNCVVHLRRVSLSQLPAPWQPGDGESSPGSVAVGEGAKPPEGTSDPLGRRRSRRGTARAAAAATQSPMPLARVGADQGPGGPEPTNLPKEGRSARKSKRRTPDLQGPARRSSAARNGADRQARPSRRSERTNSSKDEPRADPAKAKRLPAAPRERRKRSMSKDRTGTARKACVSGLSVSRWKDRGNSSVLAFPSKAWNHSASLDADCSFAKMLSTQHMASKVVSESVLQGSSVLFSTPTRTRCLNLSMLSDLAHSTHTWSRLKAALSVHRQARVFTTPGGRPSSRPGSSVRAPLGDLSQDLFATPSRTPLCKRSRSALFNSTSLLSCSGSDDMSDAEKVYAECGQRGALSWEECLLPHRMGRCAKIGEGTFGEVFSTVNDLDEMVAIKIIPVEGSKTVNGEQQKTFGEILHEIIISKELSNLRTKTQNRTNGFIGLNNLHCVQGAYPPAMLDAWDAFDQQKGSENDRPDFFDQQQFFLILEFEFGGSDLENSNGALPSLNVAKGILHQVTAALAVAEQELCFEHRDLHWGNVLVKTAKVKKGTYLLNGTNHSLDTKGVLVHIIDFSLSRLEIDGLTVSCDISADEELFMGQGDYQFDIYRLMRKANGNNWSDYRPHSNILWLHYLTDKLLSMKYRGSAGRKGKSIRDELTRFHDDLLQYSSATDALQNCPLFQ